MARVLFFLALTGCGVGLVAWTAWHPELWEPTMEAQGLDRESRTFRAVIKGFVAAVVGIPLILFINAVGRLGADRGTTDRYGYTVLRLRAGMRGFLVVAALGLAAMFFALPIVDPETRAPWAFQAGGTVILVLGLVAVTAKVRYDNRTVGLYNLFTGWRMRDWADLVSIRENAAKTDLDLHFRSGRKMSISYRYAGLDDLIGTAEAKLNAHAGTPRGRNRQTWS